MLGDSGVAKFLGGGSRDRRRVRKRGLDFLEGQASVAWGEGGREGGKVGWVVLACLGDLRGTYPPEMQGFVLFGLGDNGWGVQVILLFEELHWDEKD